MSMLAARMGSLAIILYAAAPAPSSLPSVHSLEHATESDRAAYVRRATIWAPTTVASMDFMVGPPRKDGFPFDEKVSCDYIQPDTPMGGDTPKFTCALSPDDVVKVKYGRKNGEVYAAVAASRLLWALGFGADTIYPVQVTCRNCPIEPWWWSTERRVPEKTYELATIERRLPGERIESKPDQGWAWPELDTVDESAGGAPRAQRDALKLLMVLLQNSDSKPDNQKLLCLPGAVSKDAGGNETCAHPFMYVKDLGTGFGAGTLFDNSKADLASWETEVIWKDKARCVGNLKKSMLGTFGDPQISEAGRKFLADLLVQLTDKQINDMFTVARVDRYHEHPERNRPIADWVRAFNTKRAAIVDQRCPS